MRRFKDAAYRGYGVRLRAEPDEELTRVGPGTPCGEYLRRFWHPVALSSDLADLPVALTILGEELVVFRDGEGRVGLVHRRCPHRRASLEYGSCRPRGIRCCYHGWHFDIDGTLLDAPGQPPEAQARLKRRIRLGAYPAFEYQGLVFAYLGPPEEMPELPVYDTFELPDDALTGNLRNGHLSGAVLDVFDPEPLPPDSPLWGTPNLIVTPHVSADDGDAYVSLTLELVFRNLERLLEGRPLVNVVRPELGY